MFKKNIFKSLLTIFGLIFFSMFGFVAAFGYGGGGGVVGMPVTPCSSASFGEWGVCINGFQYRDVVSQSPSNCTLTTSQQLSRSKICGAPDNESSNDNSNNQNQNQNQNQNSNSKPVDVIAVIQVEKSLVSKVNTQLANRLAGHILLQVENNGQAWYVEPVVKEKIFLGRPVDAFYAMRKTGLGISNANFNRFQNNGVPARFAGRILLKVEEHGEAYYVDPVTMKMHYLGRPDDAFRVMRELALGINNENIRQIPVAEPLVK